MKPSSLLFLSSLGLLGFSALPGQKPAATKKPVDFNREVKPILSDHCFKCHGPDAANAAAGLRLDTFDEAIKRAINPGNPDISRLMMRVEHDDPKLRMPPQGGVVKPLTPAQKDILRRWIEQGAKYEKHWSFVPPRMPAIPKVKDVQWARNDIDRFVLAALEAQKMKPEPEADRDALAMRAALTLTGLPPTLAELKAYRMDAQAGAYERYVDRLMAKSAYGEQQARYWLDAVRYGDTHGLQLDNERSVFPYRDWVVRAFNQDLPFDKFAQWQLAGDLLDKPTTEQMIATGYVRMNLTTNEGGAIEDEFLARNTFDRVDTASTVFLGLTVACAKCHDHKYDPIKQSDYYGLYAYFNSTTDKPLDGNIALPPPVMRAPTPKQAAQIRGMQYGLDSLLVKIDPDEAADWFERNHPPVPKSRDWQISPVVAAANFDKAFDKAAPGEPGQPEAAWKPFKFEPGKDHANLIGKDSAFVYVRGILTAKKAGPVTLGISSDDGVRVWLNGKEIHTHKIGRGLNLGIDPVRADLRAGDNRIVVKVVNGTSIDGLNIRLGDKTVDLAVAAYRREATAKTKADLQALFLTQGPPSTDTEAYRGLSKAKADFEASLPMTLIAQEMAKPRPTFILKRGEYNLKGDPVTRHIPPVLGALSPKAPNNRRGLAEWMTTPENPLVARVFVNRLWQQNFGTGIVKTVEDFGSQGEWPQNQALMDYLAVSFVRNGWSVKKLNRMIVTSAAFRQSSRISPAKLAKDPENRLISRGPRYRLDAEVIRDRALAAGGLLVQQVGGRGFKPYQPDGLWEGASDPESSTHFYVRDKDRSIYRRSMYLFWKRTSPPPMMVTFDAPLRDSCTVKRSQTNTPLQALTVMNEPAFLEASRTMAERVLQGDASDAQRLQLAYQVTLGRAPDEVETGILLKSLARYRARYERDPESARRLLMVGDWPQSKTLPAPEQAAWMLICSSIMNTNEFVTLR
jgi:mono/diheme cytochrome c family protein